MAREVACVEDCVTDYTELIFDTSTPEGRGALRIVDDHTCDKCGDFIEEGDWPFCPHGRGVYAWKSGFSMKLQGWTRRER